MSLELTRKTSRLRLAPGLAGVHLTPDEFDRATTGRGNRYELIGGVLVVSPHPGNGEVDPNEFLGFLLMSHKRNHPQGSAIDKALPEQTIPVGDDRRRMDRAIWVGLGRTPDPRVDVPAIAVEFVSRSRRDIRRDYEIKRDEYLAIGVREYWIIDRYRRTMTVHRRDGDRTLTKVVTEGQSHETDLLPGFVLPLAELLKLADDWAPPAKPLAAPEPETPPAEDA
ncbi:Uma2 family endonuclease [Isosphaeraceae bacterium EP7]